MNIRLAALAVQLFLWAEVPGEERSPEAAIELLHAQLASLQQLEVQLLAQDLLNLERPPDRFAVCYRPGYQALNYQHGAGSYYDTRWFQRWLVDGEPIRTCFPLGRVVKIGENSNESRDWHSHFLRAIGWHPDAEFFRNESVRRMYEPLSKADVCLEYVKSPETDERCILVTRNGAPEQQWLSVEHGYAIAKSVFEVGDERTTYLCSKFQEVSPGLWLPRLVEIRGVNVTSDKPVVGFRMEIERVRVNDDVNETNFEFVSMPGTLTVNENGDRLEFEPGGVELLDRWSAVFARHLSQGIPPTPSGITQSDATSLVLLVAVLVTLFLPLVVHFGRRILK